MTKRLGVSIILSGIMNQQIKLHQKEISRKLTSYCQNEKWQQAKKLLENELLKFPADHWHNSTKANFAFAEKIIIVFNSAGATLNTRLD